MRILATALCVLMIGCSGAASAAQLLADGGFESDPTMAGGYTHVAAGTKLGGAWTVTGVDVLVVDTNYAAGSGPALDFNAAEGRTSLDLTGVGNSGPGDGIYQDVQTTFGQLYTLSFAVGRATGTGSVAGDYTSGATARLSINGGPLIDFANTDSDPNHLAWKTFSYEFRATDTTTRIAFLNGDGNDYLGLDNVSLTVPGEVPEPASWALMTAGFGALGGTMRRKRSVAFA